MILGYARVSSEDQNLDLQRDALAKAGANRVFEEHASGARIDRPALADVLDHLRKGDTLVVWKLDRLGRTVRQLIELVEDLNRRGVDFVSLTDRIDTTTPAGRFMFHILAAVAQMERDLIRERTQAGLTAARSRGRQGGRKRKLSKIQLASALALLKADPAMSVTHLAGELGVDRSTLYRAIGEADRKEVRT